MNIDVINVIPNSLSGETGQDSEPSISVNPENPLEIVVTAFTGNPTGGANAPVFVSTNGGASWVLNANVPSEANAFIGTGDIKTAFAGTGGRLYGGILRRPGNLRVNLLRGTSGTASTPMTILEDRDQVDQPFTEATSVSSGPDIGADRFYTGLNDFAAPGGKTASIDICLDANAASPTIRTVRIESRATSGQDGPQIRPAVHSDGTIYAVFYGWRSRAPGNVFTSDVVVVRDDDWGRGGTPFTDLTDPADGLSGRIVTSGASFTFGAQIGNERVGGDLSIAVDPGDSSVLYIAYCDVQAGEYTIHVRRSTDRGDTWSSDLATVANATNPTLAINNAGKVAFAFQQVVGFGASQRWETHFQTTTNAFSSVEDKILADVPANTPTPAFQPYIGDYMHMVAMGSAFFGVFSANNTPDIDNFPEGVTYQRNANFTTNTLQALNGVTPVAVSIDPFFFKATEFPTITRFTRFTNFTRFTRFTNFTRFTRFTRFTNFTRFTRFTNFTRFTRFTRFTNFTRFTRFTEFTRFTNFTKFTRFSRFGPFTPPSGGVDPGFSDERAEGDFIRFQNRVFAPEELALDALPVFEEMAAVFASVGITHLHQLAVASPSVAADVGMASEDFDDIVAVARSILRGLAR